MDEIVARSLAKWPNVPAVYGWLELDRRGNWRIKGERITHQAFNDFIARNYECDKEGRWYFQNGPQRVYVTLAYTPLVVHYEGDALFDHCGRVFSAKVFFVDEEGSLLIEGDRGIALLDDRDLARFADAAQDFPLLQCAEVPGRYGYQRDPKAA